ncbi:hypothetical protein nbrc107696_07110 [Gordonia spumicola]|uniref:Uncharacterized protein n=1 Tax=Gordonia spumicola TaxID=589161 RepID=A0A7I9V4A0_9ACTN|nr:hypothetical protein nbrc107696_07110 [Gordonia spumicola]
MDLAQHLSVTVPSLTDIRRRMRDGSLSAVMADPVGLGIAAVDKRVPLDSAEKAVLARRVLWSTPGEAKNAATVEGIRSRSTAQRSAWVHRTRELGDGRAHALLVCGDRGGRRRAGSHARRTLTSHADAAA